ncbi:Transcription factor MYC/MYB N-terminal [Cynara cardunculus var. scolymus]|uniref:Transcription factor n=1 Tax=Cynara cardunculus var. scolymus TaxID=59895 RepID=A0A118JT02_CYNCS|nr:Transcription factor MYC/MYB N-terminal [Cynara cardunculus var. scolymus]
MSPDLSSFRGNPTTTSPPSMVSPTFDLHNIITDSQPVDHDALQRHLQEQEPQKKVILELHSIISGSQMAENDAMDEVVVTDREWFFFISMTHSFINGNGLVGQTMLSNEAIWICGREGLLVSNCDYARQGESFGLQKMVCIPSTNGVVEFGSTELIRWSWNIIKEIGVLFNSPLDLTTTNGDQSTCPSFPAMYSTQAIPSSSALCANIGPGITSPMAKTPFTFVEKRLSTGIRPILSVSTPMFSKPSPAMNIQYECVPQVFFDIFEWFAKNRVRLKTLLGLGGGGGFLAGVWVAGGGDLVNAKAASWINSPAFEHIMWTPNTLSVSFSAIIFTNPSASSIDFALLLPNIGNFPTV